MTNSTGQGGAVMTDWLALHGLTPVLCARVLQTVPLIPKISHPGNPSVDCTPETVWAWCAEAASACMPEAREAASEVLVRARVNFAPDPDRYPRAFTLHDDGEGAPYVSCPWNGQLSDLLVLGHEFGHALQIVASDGRQMAPVARETCAYLSETWLTWHLHQHPFGPNLAKLGQRKAASVLAGGDDLLAAVQAPETAYDYGWNYPLAQGLALMLAEISECGFLWPFFAGQMALPSLIDSLDIRPDPGLK